MRHWRDSGGNTTYRCEKFGVDGMILSDSEVDIILRVSWLIWICKAFEMWMCKAGKQCGEEEEEVEEKYFFCTI